MQKTPSKSILMYKTFEEPSMIHGSINFLNINNMKVVLEVGDVIGIACFKI